jgi:hypothetical protein
MKDCILFFFKVMLVLWWLILGIIITVVPFYVKNGYMAFLSLFMMTVWVSLSGTAIYWSNKGYIGKRGKDE